MQIPVISNVVLINLLSLREITGEAQEMTRGVQCITMGIHTHSLTSETFLKQGTSPYPGYRVRTFSKKPLALEQLKLIADLLYMLYAICYLLFASDVDRLDHNEPFVMQRMNNERNLINIPINQDTPDNNIYIVVYTFSNQGSFM